MQRQFGILPNIRQFLWLVLNTLFVGFTIGMERTVVPLLGKNIYHVQHTEVILAFIVSFGTTKAILNLVAGRWSDKIGRRPILLLGWVFGIPMVLLLLFVHSWTAVIFANVLLGANQAFAWTMTINQQLDLAGPKERGLTMGINEGTGYLGVSLATIITGYLAAHYGLITAPFVFGLVVVVLALLISLVFVKETKAHVHLEKQSQVHESENQEVGARATALQVLWNTLVIHPGLSAVSQAGMVNKLADTLMWGVLPLYLLTLGISVAHIGIISGTYTLFWGLSQFGTGVLSDWIGRKIPIVTGMFLLGSGSFWMANVYSFDGLVLAAAIMGIGMALLYPNLNAAVGDLAPPDSRGSVLGVYRLWRDGGYAIGGLLLGFAIHAFGMKTSIEGVGLIVLVTTVLVVVRLKETYRGKWLTKKK